MIEQILFLAVSYEILIRGLWWLLKLRRSMVPSCALCDKLYVTALLYVDFEQLENQRDVLQDIIPG